MTVWGPDVAPNARRGGNPYPRVAFETVNFCLLSTTNDPEQLSSCMDYNPLPIDHTPVSALGLTCSYRIHWYPL